MNTTILNYPSFQTLPKGIKQMLVVSETHFFNQPASHDEEQKSALPEKTTMTSLRWPCAGYVSAGFLRPLEHCLNAE